MKINATKRELLFQFIVHTIVLVFYVFDREQSGIEVYKVVSFINYAVTAGIINYLCLPIFYKNKHLLSFIAMVLACLLSAALLEEFVLERLFFTGNRADSIKMVWALIDIVPVVAILSGVKFGWDAIKKQNELEELEQTVRESELQFLKSQINPHFLFNNLNNLYSYALEGSKKTPQIILDLSSLLRYMLYECSDQFVSLHKEVEQLRNFVNLNELQIEDRGDVSFDVSEVNDRYQIAPLIMMVFVENAFKHSQNSQSEGIEISIEIRQSVDGKLNFTCVNSHQLMDQNETSLKGIGLENVKKRLELIYPDAHDLTLSNIDDRYTVNLSIDLGKRNIS